MTDKLGVIEIHLVLQILSWIVCPLLIITLIYVTPYSHHGRDISLNSSTRRFEERTIRLLSVSDQIPPTTNLRSGERKSVVRTWVLFGVSPTKRTDIVSVWRGERFCRKGGYTWPELLLTLYPFVSRNFSSMTFQWLYYMSLSTYYGSNIFISVMLVISWMFIPKKEEIPILVPILLKLYWY